MIRQTLIVVAAVLLVTHNPLASSGSAEITVGGASVVSFAQAPMMNGTTSLSLDWGPNGQTDQFAIADVLSYDGSKPTITAPDGWQLIRDDYTRTTRQSLYWHAIQANDSSTASWTFSEPVDAQGAILLLDNVGSASLVDMTAGNTGTGGTMGAKPVVSTANGDLIIGFFATDFYLPGLTPQIPGKTRVKKAASNEFWILSTYQSQNGGAGKPEFSLPHVFNWTAAQVAIRNGPD
jgi:hypothetical protein